MEPHLARRDLKLFRRILRNSSVVFEYGSGGSTYEAANSDNIQKVYSVESDSRWIQKVHNKTGGKIHKVQFLYADLNCTRNVALGYPGPGCTDAQCRAYSQKIHTLTREQQQAIDLVFIDGRFRVACCLHAHSVIADDCCVIFDDFLNRQHYSAVLHFFDIVTYTADRRLVVLKKKPNTIVPQQLIHHYETDSR